MSDELPTREEAIGNAVRLLRAAENETDRSLMDHLQRLAEIWIAVADQQRDID
jgi:hypothetical protein